MTYLRIFSAFGEGQFDANLWPSLRAKAMAGEDFPMTSGAQIRDFVPVEEVVEQFLDALAFDGVAPGRPKFANVGSGHARSVLDFTTHWWHAWHARGHLMPGALPYRDGEIMRLVPQL